MPALTAEQTQALVDATIKAREYLTDRIGADSLDLVRLYRHHRDEFLIRVQRIYDAFLAKHPTLVQAKGTEAWEALMRVTSDMGNSLGKDLALASVENLQGMLASQRRAVAPALRSIFGDSTAFVQEPVSVKDVLAEVTTTVQGGSTFTDKVLAMSEDVKQNAWRGIRSGLLNGDDFDTVRQRLSRQFGVDQLAEPKYNAYGSVKTYENVARDLWNRTMSDIADDLGELSVWYAVLDERTTPGCLARHGRTLDDLGEQPPRHINCRCTVAVMDAETDLRELQAEATPFLEDLGYSRRRAFSMESVREAEQDALDDLLEAEFDEAKHSRDEKGRFASTGNDVLDRALARYPIGDEGSTGFMLADGRIIDTKSHENVRHIYMAMGETGINYSKVVSRFIQDTGSVRWWVDPANNVNVSTVGAPSPTQIKAMVRAAREYEGNLNIDIMKSNGAHGTADTFARPTVDEVTKFFEDAVKRVRAREAEFDETLHPRDEGGKFTSGGGSSVAKIEDDVHGSHSGQIDGTLRARDAQGHQIGYLDYSLFRGNAHINMVEVPPESRRQGIGNALMDQLEKSLAEFRGDQDGDIKWGMTTPEGTALKAAWEGKRPPRDRATYNDADETITLLHGTSAGSADAIQEEGFKPLDAKRVANAVEDRYGLPTDSVFNHEGFSFETSFRKGDEDVYLSGSRDTAQHYTSPEPLTDALAVAYQIMHPEWGQGHGDRSMQDWVDGEKASWGEPAMLAVTVPWRTVAEAFPNMRDEYRKSYATFKDALGDLEDTATFAIPAASLKTAKIRRIAVPKRTREAEAFEALVARLTEAEFDETKHPRDDAGRFTDGSDAGAPKAKPEKPEPVVPPIKDTAVRRKSIAVIRDAAAEVATTEEAVRRVGRLALDEIDQRVQERTKDAYTQAQFDTRSKELEAELTALNEEKKNLKITPEAEAEIAKQQEIMDREGDKADAAESKLRKLLIAHPIMTERPTAITVEMQKLRNEQLDAYGLSRAARYTIESLKTPKTPDELRVRIDAVWTKQRENGQRLHAARVAEVEAYTATYKEVVEAVLDEPMGPGERLAIKQPARRTKTFTDREDAIKRAATFYPRSWWDQSEEDGTEFHVDTSKARGHYMSMAEGAASVRLGNGNLHTVAVHELGHHFERVFPWITSHEKAFWDRRTKGEKPKKLQTLAKGQGYRKHEMAVADEFGDPYVGKVQYSSGHMEVFTMGMQALVDRSLGKIRADKDHMALTLGLIVGTKPKMDKKKAA